MWEVRSAAAIGSGVCRRWTRVAAAECASHIEERAFNLGLSTLNFFRGEVLNFLLLKML